MVKKYNNKMAQIFNFIDSNDYVTIQTTDGLNILSELNYPKNVLHTMVNSNILILFENDNKLVVYDYNIDTCNITSTDVFDLQDKLNFMFSLSGGGGGGIVSVNATTPLTSSGGSNPIISFEPQADGTYLILFNGGNTTLISKNIPIFLDENATIDNFVLGQTHYYIGKAPITFDYDLLPYPSPAPVSGFNLVNQSVFNIIITSYFGNYSYSLAPNQSLKNIQVTDNGSAWEILADEYFDNRYNLQEVTDKGAVTTNALTVRNNPDTYRARYSILGQDVQRDDLGFRVSYYENGITKSTNSNGKTWQLQVPDITGNTNNSSFLVAFRPNVSGTVAYLSDIPTLDQVLLEGTTATNGDYIISVTSNIASLTQLETTNEIVGKASLLNGVATIRYVGLTPDSIVTINPTVNGVLNGILRVSTSFDEFTVISFNYDNNFDTSLDTCEFMYRAIL